MRREQGPRVGGLLLILFLSFMVALCVAKPISKKPGHFKVSVIGRPHVTTNGLSEVQRAYAKHGIKPISIPESDLDSDLVLLSSNESPAGVSRRAEESEYGVVTNEPTTYDIQYLSPVTVGGQELMLNLDTGSTDAWVLSTRVHGLESMNRTVFDPAKSTTYSDMEGHSFHVLYGDGSYAFGSVGQDTMDIGGATVDKQAIGLPNFLHYSLILDMDCDGIIGLGSSNNSRIEPERQMSFLENVSEDLEEPVFTAQLKPGAPGSYEFGRVDPSKHNGPLIEVPVDFSRGHWEIPTSMFMVGDDSSFKNIQTINENGTHTAVVDTGTTMMLVNQQITDAYYAQVEGAFLSGFAGGYVFPCNTTLPPLHLALGASHFVRIPGPLLNFREVARLRPTGERICMGGLQPNSGHSIQIWGATFLKAVFTVFNLRGPTMKFAPHAELVSETEAALPAFAVPTVVESACKA